MNRCKQCGSDNIKYSYSRLTRRKGHQLVRAVYYCFECLKETEIVQKIEMLQGIDEEVGDWVN